MQILAERFLVNDTGVALDLASGERVLIRVATGGDVDEQTEWAAGCDFLYRVRHPAVAPLVDYGALGTSRRFEAWRCDAAWRGAAPEAGRVVARADRFMRAGRWSTRLAAEGHRCHTLNGRCIVVPSGWCAESEASRSGATTGTLVSFAPPDTSDSGVCRIERPAVTAIAELFRTVDGCRPHVVVLWGPPHSGRGTASLDLARAARLCGFVPIRAELLNAVDGLLLARRNLFVIDRCGSAPRWRALVKAACRSPRLHIVLVIAETEMRSTDGLGLDLVPPSALAAAVCPSPATTALAGRIARAAIGARGLPGRFVNLLWTSSAGGASSLSVSRRSISRVAEQVAVYGADKLSAERASADRRARWAAPAELASFRHQLESASALLQGGRYAAGQRGLRQAIAALARRGDWSAAAQGAVALASAILRRGRPEAAERVCDDALQYADRGDDHAWMIEAAALKGHALIDRIHLGEAEAVLASAVTAVRRAGGPSPAPAVIALARCLFWAGRYGEAQTLLDPLDGEDLGAEVALRASALGARVAIGCDAIPRAMSCVARSRSLADRAGSPSALALSWYSAAFVHLAVGDLDAASRDVEECLGAAVAARDRLRAARARLLQIEIARRAVPACVESQLLRRVLRVSRCLPPLARVRVECLTATAGQPSGASDEATRRRSTQSGLAALNLYLRSGARSSTVRSGLDTSDDLIALVHMCQSAEDEAALLTKVCASVRTHLHAAAAAFFIKGARACEMLAGSGSPIDAAIAERTMDASVPIAPQSLNGRLEAAAPVRYGGTTLGALAVRWPLGTTYDLSRAGSFLTMAAAAAGPAVSAAAARLTAPVAAATHDVLGVSAAIAELRRTIERAASAPFAVLIEGESGSGKELVARAVHRSGSRRHRPFCTVNCAAIPDELVEAELFGHAKGAFTGALTERAGVFEEAHGGTLFLDEVGELSMRAQAKLLRAIQEGELRRIGENLSRRVDVRIVSATNRDLRTEIAAGRFREDLLYRLDVIRIEVAPLRERREDIPLLVAHFWRQATERIESRAVLAAAVIAALARYDWPGNVRELQNVLAALAVRSPRRGVVPASALPPHVDRRGGADACRLQDARRDFEARFVRAALVRTGGHRARAAEVLGVTRQGLTKLMTRLGIDD